MAEIAKVDGMYGQDSVEMHDASPYKRLFAAKLLLHIKDYTEFLRAIRSKKQKFGKLEGRKAEAWLFSNNDEPASFLWICSILNLNPQVVRTQVQLKWREI